MVINTAKQYSDHPEGFEHLFEKVLKIARDLPEGLPFVEIGTRAGGSALLFLYAIKESGISRPLITVDPYGKPYMSGPGEFLDPTPPGTATIPWYPPSGEEKYRNAVGMLSSFCLEFKLTHIHYRQTSEQWREHWQTGGCWIEGEQINEKPFAFVYLDGEHLPQVVEEELGFFRSRMAPGGLICIDDTEHIKGAETEELKYAGRFGETEGNRLYLSIPPAVKLLQTFAKNGGRPKYAVATIACGEAYQKIGKLTHPTLRTYADRIGAEFIVIDQSDCSSPHWEKFRLYDLLEQFERIIYLDTDLIIRGDCPNLLEEVPPEKIGLFNEAPFVEGRRESMRDIAVAYGRAVPKWEGFYGNTGVMVISRCHKNLFRHPGREIQSFYEQSYLNLMIASMKTPVHKLSFRLNRMTCTDEASGEERHGSFLAHYAGWQNLPQTLQTIRGDLARWEELKPLGYPTWKHIVIDVHGGLGDQVQAEPAIRFALENVWTPMKGNFQIDIKSHWPRLFEHLEREDSRISLHEHSDWVPLPNVAYRVFNTLPGPETVNWTVVSNLLCHTIDFCSMALLRRTLPMEAKRIKLEVEQADLISVTKKAGRDDLKELVLVHGGLHWSSKSFPIEWWQELTDRLSEANLTLCLIGQDEETRGVYPLQLPENAIDLRNKTSLGELIALLSEAQMLISNDSGPVHLAGAFDNWIILFPTCKAAHHLLPWRHGSQGYKTLSLCKREMIDDLLTDPMELEPDPKVNGEFLPPNKSWSDYLLEPEEVVEEILKVIEVEEKVL